MCPLTNAYVRECVPQAGARAVALRDAGARAGAGRAAAGGGGGAGARAAPRRAGGAGRARPAAPRAAPPLHAAGRLRLIVALSSRRVETPEGQNSNRRAVIARSDPNDLFVDDCSCAVAYLKPIRRAIRRPIHCLARSRGGTYLIKIINKEPVKRHRWK